MTLKLRHIALILLVTSASFLVGGGWHWFVGDGFIQDIIFRVEDPYGHIETWQALFMFCGPALGLVGLIGSFGVCVLPLVKDANLRGTFRLSLFGLFSILLSGVAFDLVPIVAGLISFKSTFGMVLCCVLAAIKALSVLLALAGVSVAAIGLIWSVAEVIASRQKYARLPWLP